MNEGDWCCKRRSYSFFLRFIEMERCKLVNARAITAGDHRIATDSDFAMQH
jgi:hypothetical protein